jgi:putative ABC transport system permease protein
MAIPIIYNIRNLRLRLAATIMTALGIALTVSIALFIMALLSGLSRAFVRTGSPENVLVIRKGSQSELSSYIGRELMQVIRFLPGIARNSSGEPLASGEMTVVIVLPRKDGSGEVNVTVRGLTRIGPELRHSVSLQQGRWFEAGRREVVVSHSIDQRFAGAQVGNELEFGKGKWTVVGIFDGGGTAFDSEIWGDVNQMSTDFDRDGYSSVLLKAEDAVAAEGLKNRVNDDQRLKLEGILEADYYAQQTSSGAPIQFVGTVVAVLMAIGSCFAAMNTMYASVAYRMREIATLRVLGFGRLSILVCFVLESLILAILGAAIGVLMMLPLNGLTTGTSNMVTFAEVVFSLQFTPGVILAAFVFAILMGLIGGVAPAWHGARQNILSALRD